MIGDSALTLIMIRIKTAMEKFYTPRTDLNTMLLASGFFALFSILTMNDVSAAERETQSLAMNLDEVEWGPSGGGNGTPLGLRTSRQGIDPETGGITYYAMFPAGTHFDLHWHTYDEHVVVVKGKVTIVLGDQAHDLEAGSYVVIPGKLNHSWDVPAGDSEVVILVRRVGPADFHFVAE
jgi:mannose-6-phosphate isomerase-like protein (cupin superfamily)